MIQTPVRLRPFFSFYGSKWKLGPKYPAPVFDRIIEPFAGSAGYSLCHFEKDVVLYDADPLIVSLWKYLIGATKKDIEDLPLCISDLRLMDLAEGAKHLIGFWLCRSGSSPANVPHSWMRTGLYETSFWSKEKRQRVADQVQYVKHWRCYHGRYDSAPDVAATWFVDPPYAVAGRHYRYRVADYVSLGEWVSGRQGQVIATEQHGASWLPFRPFALTRTPMKGGRFSTEAIWLNGYAPVEV